MVNTRLARYYVKKSGKKYKYIAEKMGITPYSLTKKIENKSPISTKEVNMFCEEIGITDKSLMLKIFFANELDFKSNKSII